MTLSKRVIPCLDVAGGRVVKGVNFQNLVDAGDPVELAKIYGNAEADFFSARSLFPAAARLFKAADAAGLNNVVPDYRQMFIPKVGKEQ